jgi:signal transduction histidine kinase
MRKSVWIFLLAVLIPSAVLGWLALRTAEEQKIILERRTAELYQRETEGVASAARAVIDEQRRSFSEAVRILLADSAPDAVAQEFAVKLGDAWERKAVGFAINRDGRLVSPTARAANDKPDWQHFLLDHGAFLGGKLAATVYNVPVDALTQPEVMRKKGLLNEDNYAGNKMAYLKNSQATVASRNRQTEAPERRAVTNDAPDQPDTAKDKAPVQQPASPSQKLDATAAAPAPKPSAPKSSKFLPPAPSASPAAGSGTHSRMNIGESSKKLPETAPALAPAAPEEKSQTVRMQTQGEQQFTEPNAEPDPKSRADYSQQLRNVQPQQQVAEFRPAWSALAPETTEFRLLCEGLNEGVLTRFVQDKLTLVFWTRPAQSPELIFGCVIDTADLSDLWPAIMPEPNGRAEVVLALLDDRARPVATSVNGSLREWKRPFVASEIGEALPHWEAALYLMRPEQIAASATVLRRSLGFLVVGMLGAIILGSWLVAADARRQFALAQQKTDFVSNVSHELKTPLTSIRMFAELMLCGRAETQAKVPQYLRIIMVEAERLTRLINNVLDFAKLERRQKRVERKPLDLHDVVERTWESHELHLRESGFATKWEAAPAPYRVEGDEDALAQILVNLLSNAEKYSGDHKEVELHTYIDDGEVCVAVLDRGAGVPAGEERKIFEAFYRAHDSLSSGVQGSGLGLTLAQHLAREMGGRIEYRRREGGGSEFAFWMPLVRSSSPS